MLFSVSPWFAIILYLVASFAASLQFWNRSSTAPLSAILDRPLLLGLAAWVCHVIYASSIAFDWTATSPATLELNLSVHAMSALVSAILVGTFLMLCLLLDVGRLAALVFPITALTLIFAYYWNVADTHVLLLSRESALSLKLHVLISILAYAFISLATAQALLHKYQETQFKNRVRPTLMAALPPLETMEKLLFHLLAIGVFLLTLTLVSGAFFSRDLFGVPFEFNHHTVLALAGWAVMSITLAARLSAKLNGSEATKWILLGFVLIQLGYFGTKIISDLLN